MLLVTFHGGSGQGAINNVWGFPTSGSSTPVQGVLSGLPGGLQLDELRGMAVFNGDLYVVNGSRNSSGVLQFAGPPQKGPAFQYVGTAVGAGQSIAHPFGTVFVVPAPPSPALPTICYVPNQDSNVVAQVDLTAGENGAVNGSLPSTCPSAYLTQTFPGGSFLEGTFVASQNTDLDGMPPGLTPVPESNGGLGVSFKNDKKGNPTDKPQNSVRDVAIANGILFVCDEADSAVKMYNLNGGAPILPSASAAKNPTHLAVDGSGLWVSAKANLYWSALPASPAGASLSFYPVQIAVPDNNSIGGISFDDAGSVYVLFQDGTGGTGTGSIVKCTVTAGAPPTLSPQPFALGLTDTPEFCLWVSDSNWPV